MQLVQRLRLRACMSRQGVIWQQILQIALETAEYIAMSISRRFKVLPDRHFEAMAVRCAPGVMNHGWLEFLVLNLVE